MANRNGNNSHKTSAILRVASFLAIRQIRRANIWTNVLIVFIMTLTFLNLVVVTGILVGLVQGVVEAVEERYLGDIIISNLKQKPYIEQTPQVLEITKNIPGVDVLTARYIESGTVASDYKTNKKRESDLDKSVGTSIVGIDPEAEDATTGLSHLLIQGEYLDEDDYDQVLLGALLLKEYLDFESPIFLTLENVKIGTKVKVTVGGNVREVTVKGIVKSKVDEIDRRVFFVDKQFRGLIGRHDYNVDEIAIRIKSDYDPIAIKNALIKSGVDEYARVQTREDAEPKFVKDLKNTFALLGNIMSSIGLSVAVITVFIVIFINAITRRKFIGIQKGIGINSKAIEFAYVIQSLFYAVLGTAFGILIVFGFLKPYLSAHPINFPFSDGILVATFSGTAIRVFILFIATLVAGYIPAKIVVRQNTLDAILGR